MWRILFSGQNIFFLAFAPKGRPELIGKGLGRDHQILSATIKKYPVGLPIQAPMEALILLIEKHAISVGEVESVVAHVHASSAMVADNRTMPDVNLQHLLAITLLDGNLSFEAAHSY